MWVGWKLEMQFTFICSMKVHCTIIVVCEESRVASQLPTIMLDGIKFIHPKLPVHSPGKFGTIKPQDWGWKSAFDCQGLEKTVMIGTVFSWLVFSTSLPRIVDVCPPTLEISKPPTLETELRCLLFDVTRTKMEAKGYKEPLNPIDMYIFVEVCNIIGCLICGSPWVDS